MEKDNIDKLFENLNGDFDVNVPNDGHKARFIAKMNKDQITLAPKTTTRKWWKPLVAVASVVLICLTIVGSINTQDKLKGLAAVSPELGKTEDFFTSTITEELKQLDKEKSPLTEAIIYDAMRQLKTLEKDYQQLEIDLTESGNDKRVVYAMISNFQNRIDVLTNVLDKIDDLKELKTKTNETENTL